MTDSDRQRAAYAEQSLDALRKIANCDRDAAALNHHEACALYCLVNDLRTTSIPMRLRCEECGELHIDEGEFATKPHHTHACQICGHVWRPAVVATVGVKFLPGFKNEVPDG